MELPTRRADYSRWIEVVDEETGEVKRIQVHNEKGQELPDQVPVAPPLGYSEPLSMFDQMRAQIRAEHNRLRQLELEGLEETVEQANDFDVEEDLENQPSIYEEKFDPVDFELRNRLRQAEFRAEYQKRVDGLPDQQRSLLNGDNLQVRERSDQGREVDDRSGVEDNRAEQQSGERKGPKARVQGSISKREQRDTVVSDED